MTYRMYIATLAIGHDYRKGLKDALESKREYAALQGYTYVEGDETFWDRTRPIPWSKVGFVLDLLGKVPDGTLIFLSDADVMITNPTLRLEDVVEPLLPASKDLLISIDACAHINSGNMLMRNGEWLRSFWRRVGEQTDLLYHIWWENAAIIKLLETVPSDLAKTEFTTEHKRFNAYIQGLPGQPLWAPGDLLVHFAGIYDVKKMERLQEEIKKEIYKQNGQIHSQQPRTVPKREEGEEVTEGDKEGFSFRELCDTGRGY